MPSPVSDQASDQAPPSRARWRPLRDAARRVWHGVFYVFMALVGVAFLVMGIVGIVELDRPVYWGTFTEESTDCGSRSGCSSTGRWVSDDGTRVRENIRLDGNVDPGDSVRAGYRPGGAWGDTNIVHTKGWVNGAAWVPFLCLLGTVVLTWWQHRKWRSGSTGPTP